MTMRTFTNWIIILVLGNGLVGCSPETPPRIKAYLGPESDTGTTQNKGPVLLPADGIQAGLLVLNDTSAPGSAPSLSQQSLASLTEGVRILIMKSVPINIVEVLDNTGITPNGDPQEFIRLANEERLEYLLLAIFSSNESEIPTYLPINGIIQGGGGPNTVPGYEAQNFSLVEIALLDGGNGVPLVQAHGRAYSTLYRLNVPTESNVYPVITRAQLFNPIYPKENNAHDVLRGIAGDDALKQAVMHLQEVWDDKFST